jgi:predicted TIM-barrel fold metal-dependent hydrolase
MQLKHGLISADSHVVLDKDAFKDRMSASKWGDKIPRIVEATNSKGETGERWSVYESKGGRGFGEGFGVANCPAVMGDPFPTYPTRWEQVPRTAWDPLIRLHALDEDGVDAEVLFPNNPGGSFYQHRDPDFEMDAIRAYNDALSDWASASDRYLPLAGVPYLSGPEAMARETERAVEGGHKGINLNGRMPGGLPHLGDPVWDPVWATLESLGVPVHFHGSSGLNISGTLMEWDGFSVRQNHSASTTPSAVTPGQIIPHLIFSGITERFPNLKVVFAEAGIGGLNYVIAACDHEWETRHLWTEGITSRPSDTVRRQMYANFWFEDGGIQLRENIGINNIMWESDFPHVASFHPNSWLAVERVLEGVSVEDRKKLLYENAIKVYRIDVTNLAEWDTPKWQKHEPLPGGALGSLAHA